MRDEGVRDSPFDVWAQKIILALRDAEYLLQGWGGGARRDKGERGLVCERYEMRAEKMEYTCPIYFRHLHIGERVDTDG